MIFPSNERSTAVLRLQVTDEWTVEEFADLLMRTVRGYEPIENFRVLSDLVEQENSLRAREPVWRSLFVQPYAQPFAITFEEILRSVHSFAFPLTIKGIRISSPGWIEVIGALNPLKIISEFITNCRAENTKRMHIDADVHIADEHEATERMRIRAEFAQKVLEMIPKHARVESAHRIVDVSRGVIEPSIEALESLARDPRVERVRLLRSPNNHEEAAQEES